MIDKKQQDIIQLAEKGGRDAELLLLDRIHELEDRLTHATAELAIRVADVRDSIPQLTDIFDKIELIQGKQGIVGEKGERGDIGEKGESIKGEKGDEGKPSQVPGPKGDRGNPGEDGVDAPPVDINEIIKQLSPPDLQEIRDDIEALRKDLETRVPATDEARPIFGPGKTRILKIDLSSQLNGVLKTFALGTHFGILQVDSSSAPFGAFRETVDYTESGRNIIFTSNVDASISLATGQSLIVKVLR